MTRRVRCRRGDSGAGTVLVLLVATVVWTVGTWSVTAIAVATTRQHAGAAADLAALAAAGRAREGDAVACRAARDVAEANGAQLQTCTVDDETRTADVTVSVRGHGALARAQPAIAAARAGPSEAG